MKIKILSYVCVMLAIILAACSSYELFIVRGVAILFSDFLKEYWICYSFIFLLCGVSIFLGELPND